MTTQEQYLDLYRAAQVDDDAFQAQCVRQFGKTRAGTMRYRTDLHDVDTLAAGERYRATVESMRGAARQIDEERESRVGQA